MKNSPLIALIAAVAAGAALWFLLPEDGLPVKPNAPTPAPTPCPGPGPCPKPTPPNKPKPKPKPWDGLGAPVGAVIGGKRSPDGTPIQCDLPGSLQQKNIAAKGLGCCVFRSCDHAARLQNVPALIGFPEWMVAKGIEGGGYPAKVDKLIPEIAKDRGYPTPQYVQAELSGQEAVEFLRLGCGTGRMACVTYSKSPTGRYGGQRIAHMVNAAHCDDKFVAILDNNYIGEDAYEWVSHDEFLKICQQGEQVWVYFLLAPPPPPKPWN